MDWVNVSNKAMEFIKKYRYVMLVLLAGLFLMMLPESTQASQYNVQTDESIPQSTLQESLEEILSQIDGAGRVRVLLSPSEGEQTLYQMDEDISTDAESSDIRRETVLVSDSGLVKQVNPPTYQGAIVLCQGADSASIRLSIVDAVANATGLTTDRITVLKMK